MKSCRPVIINSLTPCSCGHIRFFLVREQQTESGVCYVYECFYCRKQITLDFKLENHNPEMPREFSACRRVLTNDF